MLGVPRLACGKLRKKPRNLRQAKRCMQWCKNILIAHPRAQYFLSRVVLENYQKDRGDEMNILKKIVLLLSLIVLLSSCNKDNNSNSMEASEVKFSKEYITLFQNKNYEEIKKSLNTQLLNQQLQSQLENVAKYLPNEQPKSIELIGHHTLISGDLFKADLTFQYEFSSSWLIINLILEKTGNGKYTVNTFNVNPIMDSLANINKFTLNNKTLIHYIMVLFTILIPVFIIVTLIFCIITPMEKNKWLWIIFIFLGLGKISFNWTSGDINFQILSIQFFGSGFIRANNFAPWIMFTSVPIGAIIFWIKKFKHNQVIADENINVINENNNTKE